MQQSLLRALPGFIQSKRWFQAKGQTVARLEITTLDPLPDECGPDSWLCLFRVVLADGSEQTYSLFVIWRPLESGPPDSAATIAPFSVAGQDGHLIDGWTDDRLIRGLLSPMLEPKSALEGSAALLPDDIELRRLSVEQSHSAILCGNRWFLKLYRRLTVGPNPEVEMGRFLTQRGFSAIASMIGVLEWSRPDGETMALALLQSAVDAEGDAWYWMLERLSRLLTLAPDQNLRHQTIDMARHLGRRVGEMHQALAAPTSDPSFAAEAISDEHLREWARQVEREVTEVLAPARRVLPKLPAPAAALLKTVLEQETEVLRLANPPSLNLNGLLQTRFHGDLHLGQILIGHDRGAVIIDFEGEPNKPLVFRRRKHSPWRDVAGMLRSFSYAAHMAQRQSSSRESMETARGVEFLRTWEQDARRAFLASYRPGGLSEPEGILLRLFMIEKAFYELRYELNNRPDWVGIPLSGILDLIQAPNERPDKF